MSTHDRYGLKTRLNLSYVPRWVIVPMLRSQSVADHSWRVAVISEFIVSHLGEDGPALLPVIALAIWHDIHEVETGDTPSTAKDADAPVDRLTNAELVVKVADCLEAISWADMWAHREVRMCVVDSVMAKLQKVEGELKRRYPATAMNAINRVREALEIEYVT